MFYVHTFEPPSVTALCFSSSRIEFEVNVSNAKYTFLETASDLKIIILPSSDNCLMRQSFITL